MATSLRSIEVLPHAGYDGARNHNLFELRRHCISEVKRRRLARFAGKPFCGGPGSAAAHHGPKLDLLTESDQQYQWRMNVRGAVKGKYFCNLSREFTAFTEL